MNEVAVILVPLLLAFAFVTWLLYWQMRRRGLDRWSVSYLLSFFRRRRPRRGEPVHVILCIADHWEPKYGKPSAAVARTRVQTWIEKYPEQLGGFRDSDGKPPRHSFFFPVEEYEPEFLDALSGLCQAGFGEVEIHLHHDNDTPDNLRRTLADFRDLLARRHGLLSHHRNTGRTMYAFIHGNWTLCNGHPEGRYCGVNNELEILRDTGCYADLTMPSAPSPTQTRTINSIYYAVDVPGKPRSHDSGVEAGRGAIPHGGLMLIQGPLVFDWGRRKWGIVPRMENGCLQASQPPSMARMGNWLRARVQVPNRPDWFFVKLHCHGAPEDAHEPLLGEPMRAFHRDLAARAKDDPAFQYHYVTAREMYNLIRAAEAGWTGSVAEARDFELLPGPGVIHPQEQVVGGAS